MWWHHKRVQEDVRLRHLRSEHMGRKDAASAHRFGVCRKENTNRRQQAHEGGPRRRRARGHFQKYTNGLGTYDFY